MVVEEKEDTKQSVGMGMDYWIKIKKVATGGCHIRGGGGKKREGENKLRIKRGATN